MTPGSKQVASAEAITEMLEQQQALEELRESVEALEGEVEEFGGLPADLAAASRRERRVLWAPSSRGLHSRCYGRG